MRFAQFIFAVDLVKGFHAFLEYNVAVLGIGLAATIDTTAGGASHDLNDIKFFFA